MHQSNFEKLVGVLLCGCYFCVNKRFVVLLQCTNFSTIAKIFLMNALSKYLRTQCIKTALAVLAVLFLLMVGTLFTSTLRAIARGILPADLLFIELCLRSVDVLSILLPLSFFFGVLVTLSGLYRNQEAIIMQSMGWSLMNFFRALLPLAIFMFGLMLVVALVLAPKAAALSKELTGKANSEMSLMGLSEGKFQKFFADEGVIFVERVDVKNNRVEGIFASISHPDRTDTITAEYAFQFERDGEKFVALFNGFRNEGKPGSREYRLAQFARSDIKLPNLDEKIAELDEQSKPTLELIGSPEVKDQAQLHWRLMPAMTIPVLFLLAVGLSKSSPREAKFMNLIIGVLVYAFMVNLLTIGMSLLEQQKVPLEMGLWWVYLLFGAYAIWQIRRLDGPKLTVKPSSELT